MDIRYAGMERDSITFVVDTKGGNKTIRRGKWLNCIRMVNIDQCNLEENPSYKRPLTLEQVESMPRNSLSEDEEINIVCPSPTRSPYRQDRRQSDAVLSLFE